MRDKFFLSPAVKFSLLSSGLTLFLDSNESLADDVTGS